MFKKPTKKQFIIRRIILSTVATLSVIVIVTSAVLFMMGYRFDNGNGGLAQGALLQFDSNPNGASVYIDDQDTGLRTANKQTVVAGTHTVTMKRDKYQDWNRTLTLSAGTLTWLDYARLVPNDRPVEKVISYETLSSLKMSSDGKWAVAIEDPAVGTIQLIDLRSEAVKVSPLAIPAERYKNAGENPEQHSFALSNWDRGNRYVLVDHTYDGVVEKLVIDTQNISNTVNLTQLLDVSISEVKFASTNGQIFYALLSDGTIRKIDASAATLSRAFVTNASSFSVFENNVVSYIGINPDNHEQKVAGIYRDGDDAPRVLQAVDSPGVALRIATGRYHNNDYVAIAEDNAVTILKGSYPSSNSTDNSSLKDFANMDLLGAVTQLSFSPSSEYVLAQADTSFMTYEIEHRRTATGMIGVVQDTKASNLRWLDGSHLWNIDKSSLTMRDFSADNVFDIMRAEAGFDAGLSQNGRFFYAVGKSDDGYQLQRVKMILS